MFDFMIFGKFFSRARVAVQLFGHDNSRSERKTEISLTSIINGTFDKTDTAQRNRKVVCVADLSNLFFVPLAMLFALTSPISPKKTFSYPSEKKAFGVTRAFIKRIETML